MNHEDLENLLEQNGIMTDMKINLKQAVSYFHPKPSHEQVYFEAVANALDAGADRISIDIEIEAYDLPKTLKIKIKDNGIGFSDKNFEKFSSLLEVESKDHKGLGRLVYLAYFNEIRIESIYANSQKREFVFSNGFSGTCEKTESINAEINKNGSTLYFGAYNREKIHSYAYLIPERIKESLIKEFFPLLYRKKESDESLSIAISLKTVVENFDKDFFSCRSELTLDDLPKLNKKTFEDSSNKFFSGFEVYYSIEKNENEKKSIYTALCIDNRAIEYDLLPVESIPKYYQLKFIFISDFFTGKSDSSRQRIALPDEITEKKLKERLQLEIGNLISQEIPSIEEENKCIREELNNHFPHLLGYFSTNTAGLIVKQTALEEARNRFFREEQRILECESLDDVQYQKAIDLSSRVLAEYVMYRSQIISKLEDVTNNEKEDVLHNLIVPMRKTLKNEEFDDDIYSNNVWILDDRFMSYNTIFSDKLTQEIVKELSSKEVQDTTRPDITIVFSDNPNKAEKVSVVIVELKKLGLGVYRNNDILIQLTERAKMVLRYFPDKIERVWFYGITDIDAAFKMQLRQSEFKELFSHGEVFFKPQPIFMSENDRIPSFTIDLFVMTYESLISDAKSRNETFLKILKTTILKSSPPIHNGF